MKDAPGDFVNALRAELESRDGPQQRLERLRAIGVGLALGFSRQEARRATLLAVDALRFALERALAEEPGAVKALLSISTAAVSSSYLGIEKLCSTWRATRPNGAAWYDLRARFVQLGVWVSDDVFYDAATASRSARDLAARLIVAANAIEPRREDESAERHEKRVRQALADARSKANGRRRRRRAKVIDRGL